MRRAHWTVIVGLIGALAWLGAAKAWAAGRNLCLKDFEDVIFILGKPEAEAIYRAYGDVDPGAQLGMMAILWRGTGDIVGPEQMSEILKNFPPKVAWEGNPFGTGEPLLEAIGQLTHVGADGTLVMRPGLDKTLVDLAGDPANKGRGAAFDLFVADRIGYDRAARFQEPIQTQGTSFRRHADVVEECPSDCGSLPGIQHENKNFANELFITEKELTDPPTFFEDGRLKFRYHDVRLTRLGDEFARDILTHSTTIPPFEFLRINFRSVNQGQLDTIQNVLSRQFDSPLVRDAIPSANARQNLQQIFLGKFTDVVSFHP